MTNDALEKANKLKDRIRCLEALKYELSPSFESILRHYFIESLFRYLIPKHILFPRWFEILKKTQTLKLTYEEEFANDVLEFVKILIEKYKKQLEEL